MMAMPAAQVRDALMADDTETVLFLPKTQQKPPALEMSSHSHALPGFKVWLPFWIIRIGFAFDFGVPTNPHTGGAE
jgi:hypothetical protein